MKPRTTDPHAESMPAPVAIDVATLQSLFDQSPDVTFFVKDAAGRYVAVNESLVARHGLRDRSQVLGKRPADICPGDIGGVPTRQDADVLRTGRPLVDHLEMHWYAPHRPGWCLTTKLPLRDADGRVIGIVGVSRDVRTPIDAGDIPQGVADALSHFEANFDEPIKPATLASQAGLAPHRFARLIRRVFGLTPSQYIGKVRITAASRLLRETKRSVADIALACGFYDHSAFTRAFRKMTGMTPAQVRRNAQAARDGANIAMK